jgi:hypothetical protein
MIFPLAGRFAGVENIGCVDSDAPPASYNNPRKGYAAEVRGMPAWVARLGHLPGSLAWVARPRVVAGSSGGLKWNLLKLSWALRRWSCIDGSLVTIRRWGS